MCTCIHMRPIYIMHATLGPVIVSCKNSLRYNYGLGPILLSYQSSRKPSLQACTLDVDELLRKCKPIVVVHLQQVYN